MIIVTQLRGEEIVLNADLIVSLESTPDTVITLTTGKKIVVRESVSEVAGRVEAYVRRRSGCVQSAQASLSS